MICNICGNNKFSGYEGRQFKNCSSCGAMERHRHLARMFKTMDKHNFKRVLDIAPFSKFIYGDFLRNMGCEKYIGLDKWADGNPQDHRDVSFADCYMDVIGMEKVLGASSFDMVIMEQVLDEIDDYESALKSVYAVMDKNAMFLCDVALKKDSNIIEKCGENKFGNVWKFGDLFMLEKMKGIFDEVVFNRFNECGWNGDLFLCWKK